MPNLDRLLSIMAQLRDPEGGCPWDLAQDFASISPHTIEEAYEVDEAIASGDLESLRDELGDLLFQVVFQARIAEEQGAFDFSGVVDAIVDKLVRRHPHIFADAEAPTSAEGQRLNWEEIKAAERAAAGEQVEGPPDPFAGIPRSLPALARSAKVAGRMARLGPGEGGGGGAGESEGESETGQTRAAAALDQIDRQSAELRAALASGQASGPGAGMMRGALGEALQAWVQLARTLDLDPEQALRDADDEAMQRARAEAGFSAAPGPASESGG